MNDIRKYITILESASVATHSGKIFPYLKANRIEDAKRLMTNEMSYVATYSNTFKSLKPGDKFSMWSGGATNGPFPVTGTLIATNKSDTGKLFIDVDSDDVGDATWEIVNGEYIDQNATEEHLFVNENLAEVYSAIEQALNYHDEDATLENVIEQLVGIKECTPEVALQILKFY